MKSKVKSSKKAHKLFIDDSKYEGKFVATPSFANHTIVSSACTIKEAISIAIARGFDDPVVVKIPTKGTKFLF